MNTWDSVRPGDMLVYHNGTSYFVEAIVVEEPDHLTFRMRSVVSPPGDMFSHVKFWDVSHYSVDRHSTILEGITLTKG